MADLSFDIAHDFESKMSMIKRTRKSLWSHKNKRILLDYIASELSQASVQLKQIETANELLPAD
jgi:hypothetical protein